MGLEKRKQELINQLKEDIQRLELMHKNTCSKRIFKELLAKRNILETVDNTKIQRDLMFAKQRLWKKSPYTLKLLAWRVKEKTASKYIHTIRDSAGNVTSDSTKIVEILERFYENLYASTLHNSEEIKEFLASISLLSLSVEHRDWLNGPITTQKVLDTIKNLKSNTAPGRDGFPPEFYKSFKLDLAAPLANICNNILNFKLIPATWSESNIILIHKKERDHKSRTNCPVKY